MDYTDFRLNKRNNNIPIMRAKRAAYNSITKLLLEVSVVISGLVLPRLILSHFGSHYNGVTASVTQFISHFSLLSFGVVLVMQASLYKPLAQGDIERISRVVRAAEIFMRKIAIIFSGVLIAFAALYPFLVRNDFDWVFTFSLIIIIGSSTIVRVFYVITYRMLLKADQRDYITTIVSICTTLINITVASILIINGFDLRFVMLVNGVVFLLEPVIIRTYVRRRYKLDIKAEPDIGALSQRWDAFVHEITDFVNNNIDIFILTVFVGIMEVSVYAIYFMIVRNLRILIANVTGTGLAAPFGNMLAKEEHTKVEKNLRLYEFLINSIAVIFFTSAALLILPFVSVYTMGIEDVSYYRPAFALLLCAVHFMFTIRLPYIQLFIAAGHFKQTRNGAIIETCIHIAVSLALVSSFGLVGVALGALCAMIYRTVELSIYVSKHIVKRGNWVFLKNITLSLISAGVIFIIAQLLPAMSNATYIAWILSALPVFGVAVGITTLFAALFYRDEVRMLFATARFVMSGKRK